MRPEASVNSLNELQAKAKAESARVVISPPWQTLAPLIMSPRTVMRSVALPGDMASMLMPSERDARSAANMPARTASAICCGVSVDAAVIAGAYRSLNCGLRLAMNAATPSQ